MKKSLAIILILGMFMSTNAFYVTRRGGSHSWGDENCVQYDNNGTCIGYASKNANFEDWLESKGCAVIDGCQVYRPLNSRICACIWCGDGRAFNGKNCVPCRSGDSTCYYPWVDMLPTCYGNPRVCRPAQLCHAQARRGRDYDLCISQSLPYFPIPLKPGENVKGPLMWERQWGWRGRRPPTETNCRFSSQRGTCSQCEKGFMLQEKRPSGNFVKFENLKCVEDTIQGCYVADYTGSKCKQCDWDADYKENSSGQCD